MKLIFTQHVNLVSLQKSHHKPMEVYTREEGHQTFPYISDGISTMEQCLYLDEDELHWPIDGALGPQNWEKSATWTAFHRFLRFLQHLLISHKIRFFYQHFERKQVTFFNIMIPLLGNEKSTFLEGNLIALSIGINNPLDLSNWFMKKYNFLQCYLESYLR